MPIKFKGLLFMTSSKTGYRPFSHFPFVKSLFNLQMVQRSLESDTFFLRFCEIIIVGLWGEG